MTHTFSIKESLRFGWHKTREHSRLVFQIVLTFIAISVAQSIVRDVLSGTGKGALASVILVVLSVVLGVGAVQILLDLVRGNGSTYANLMAPLALVWKMVVAMFIVGFLTLLPFFVAFIIDAAVAALFFKSVLMFYVVGHAVVDVGALIAAAFGLFVTIAVTGVIALVCAIYLSVRYMMVRFLVVDGVLPVEAVRQSAIMTAGKRWHLFGFIIVLVLINIIGAIPWGIGLLVSLPVTMFAYTHIYTKLAR